LQSIALFPFAKKKIKDILHRDQKENMMPAKGRSPYRNLHPQRGDKRKDADDKMEASISLQNIIETLTTPNPQLSFTYEVGMRIITFTCRHPGKCKASLDYTLRAYQAREWDDFIPETIAKHRRTCPEARRR